MNKKTFMAALVLLAFLASSVAGLQAVKVTRANPLPYYFTPNHDEPVLVVETPQNYTTLNISSILLNFTVIRPSSWYTSMRTLFHMPPFGTISNVTVSLNGNEKYYDEFPKGFANSTNGWCENYSVYIGPLYFGLNTLEINVTAYTYYVSQDYYEKSGEPTYQDIYLYPMNVTDTICLSCSDASSSPAPLLSVPSESATPTPSTNATLGHGGPAPTTSPSLTQQSIIEPSQTPDRLQVGDFAPIIIPGSMIFLGIVAVGLLVYFSKRRG